MLPVMTLLIFTLLPAAYAAPLADCARRFDTVEVLEAVSSAEIAFATANGTAFAEARLAVEARMACSSDILSPAAQARIHMVAALGGFVDKRHERVPLALAGMFAAEPGHQIETKLVPEGHPIRAQVAPAMMYLRDDPGVALPAVGSGWIEADGVHATKAPAQRASIMQQLDGAGQVIATHYRWPGDDDFAWVVAGAPVIDVATVVAPKPTPSAWAHRAPWLVASGTSLITSGVLYAMAADGRAEFDAQATLDGAARDEVKAAYTEELKSMQTETNTLTYGAYIAGGLGLALGGVAVITW